MKVRICTSEDGSVYGLMLDGSPEDEDCNVLLEELDVFSWGQAMTYYHAKYLGQMYRPLDPKVWEPLDAEEG